MARPVFLIIEVEQPDGQDLPLPKLASELKARRPKTPLVFLSPGTAARLPGADHVVNSHDPRGLLNLMQELVGTPEESTF